ncbi:YitT family protein [Metamycoplasma arthritidis]|uniref:ABC transporter permease protein n=1 Tax=Metamycoplasma arthritidis (strain 158L3-1) TaxID=243272 RepID=B3PN52_META1|nr:YitT family protein [Metamycoplasma arthritidis]ACF07454.1 ABC transporter permease protein [Metamycoplasma arthritidis 158L3-1]
MRRKKQKQEININFANLNPYGVNIFNVWVKFPKKLFFIFLSALLYNVGVAIFLNKAATVASGVSALVQALTYTVSATAPYFAYIYFAINLPLIIIFWKKNSSLFMVMTLYWLIFQMVVQSFFLIPAVHNAFDKISFYYVNWTKDTPFKDLIPWDVYGTNYPPHVLPGVPNPTWPIIIYAIVGGLAAGASSGLAWKNSGSTAGSDIIVYYVSRVKKMGIGFISTIFALIIAAFSALLIGILEATGVIKNHPWNLASYLLRCISTLVYIFVYNGFVEILYPKYRKVKIEIYTKNPQKVIEHLKEIKYWHGYNYVDMTSGYTGENTTKIETMALYLEQSRIKAEISNIDPQAWIVVSTVNKIFGNFNTSKIDE